MSGLRRKKRLQAKQKLQQRTAINRRRKTARRGRLRGEDLQQLRLDCFIRDDWRCQFCSRGNIALEMDHIIPRTRGGKDELANVRALCHQCHYERHNGKKPCPSKERE